MTVNHISMFSGLGLGTFGETADFFSSGIARFSVKKMYSPMLCLAATSQIKKVSKTQRQIEGIKHLFIYRPRRTGDDQFSSEIKCEMMLVF